MHIFDDLPPDVLQFNPLHREIRCLVDCCFASGLHALSRDKDLHLKLSSVAGAVFRSCENGFEDIDVLIECQGDRFQVREARLTPGCPLLSPIGIPSLNGTNVSIMNLGMVLNSLKWYTDLPKFMHLLLQLARLSQVHVDFQSVLLG